MPSRRAVVLACAAAMLAGCASQPKVVTTKPLWPFEQLEIETSVGSIVGYVSRPEQSADRIVIALQSPPCAHAGRGRAQGTIGTSGIVWQQFKHDSVFFQFERPGGGTGPQSMIVECERLDRVAASEGWQRAIVDSVTALRDHEQLQDAPTVYIGIGDGAALALTAAARDSHTNTVALVSAVLDSDVDLAIRELSRRSSHGVPTILLLHAADDTRTPLARAEDLQRTLSAAHIPGSLLIFEHTGFDFGLRSSDADCLDLVAEALGEQVRHTNGLTSAQAISRRECAARAESDAPNDIQIEKLQRL